MTAVHLGNLPPPTRLDETGRDPEAELPSRVLAELGRWSGMASTVDLAGALGVAKRDLGAVLSRMRDGRLIKYQETPTGMLWRRSGLGIDRARALGYR